MSNQCPVCKSLLDAQASVCPQCGFKLMGTTQRFEPLTFPDESIPAAAAPQAAALLHVVRGPQTGITFQLTDKSFSIGRSPECDIFLNDMTVSREHASIQSIDGSYVIRDANSFNGVWVDNKSIDSHKLVDGDVIQIGAFCLVYKEE